MLDVKKLSTNTQITLLAVIMVVVSFLFSSFCFFINQYDIPLGILLGGISSIIPYVLFSIKEDKMSKQRSIKYTIIIIIIMSILHVSVLVLSAVLTYVIHIKLFNLFATFGAIFIGVISNVSVNLLQGRING